MAPLRQAVLQTCTPHDTLPTTVRRGNNSAGTVRAAARTVLLQPQGQCRAPGSPQSPQARAMQTCSFVMKLARKQTHACFVAQALLHQLAQLATTKAGQSAFTIAK
jgi:hypothetical protein